MFLSPEKTISSSFLHVFLMPNFSNASNSISSGEGLSLTGSRGTGTLEDFFSSTFLFFWTVGVLLLNVTILLSIFSAASASFPLPAIILFKAS